MKSIALVVMLLLLGAAPLVAQDSSQLETLRPTCVLYVLNVSQYPIQAALSSPADSLIVGPTGFFPSGGHVDLRFPCAVVIEAMVSTGDEEKRLANGNHYWIDTFQYYNRETGNSTDHNFLIIR